MRRWPSTCSRAPRSRAVVSSQELTSAFGRRRVVQYIVEGLDPTGPAQLIAKTFSESTGLGCCARICRHCPWTVRLRKVPRTSAPGLPSGAELGAVSSVTGVPLNESIDNSDSLDGVRDAARWLAKLHMSTVRLPRTFDTEREIVSTHAWAAAIGRHRPRTTCAGSAAGFSSGLRSAPLRDLERRCRFTRTSTPGTFSSATASASSTSMRRAW